jgi:5-(carboxyamino)imidazole ribonucleotide synthase
MGAATGPAADGPASIGIVGGGQLAWMLAEAARAHHVELHVQTPDPQDPAATLACSVVQADVRDVAATRELAQRCAVVSFENEWVDLDGLAALEADGVRFVPALKALKPLVCKRSQRELLQQLNLPSPRWFPLDQLKQPPPPPSSTPVETVAVANPAGASVSPTQAAAAPPARPTLPDGFSYPLMAKAASGGYDGKGTAVLRSDADLEALLERVELSNWIVEDFVRFDQELALVAARDRLGEVVCLPLVQTHQHQQVCDWVLAPLEAGHALQQAVRNIAASLLTALDYVGVLSIEFFYGPAGLMVNELAPRTHNSGHYSIEACSQSQFDLQLLCVGGSPVLEPCLSAPGALMVNLLGFEQRDADDPAAHYEHQRGQLAALADAHLHWYGKRGASPGRKLGHVTLLLRQSEPIARREEAMQRLEQVRQIWPLPPGQESVPAS